MAINTDELRNRRFMMTTIGQAIKVVQQGFAQLKESLDMVRRGPLGVIVENQTDYTKDFDRLRQAFEQVKDTLLMVYGKDGSGREVKVDITGPFKDNQLQNILDKSGIPQSLTKLETAISKIKIPEIDQKPVVAALKDLQKEMTKLPGQIKAMQPAPQEIKFPKIEIPNQVSLKESRELIDNVRLLQELIKSLPQNMPRAEFKSEPFDTSDLSNKLSLLLEAITAIPRPPDFPDSIAITNLKIPQPVTNININPLRGLVHTTATTVTDSLTPLPGYGVLDSRRSLFIYNNSSSTLYVGGSDVTTSNGLIIPATSYSPAIDAGPTMIVYGVVETGTADVRVMEVSNTSGL